MAVQVNLRKNIYNLLKINSARCEGRCYTTTGHLCAKQPQSARSIESAGSSIAAKGFLRPNKPYNAPTDAAARVNAISSALQLPNNDAPLTNLALKFQLLEACFKEFQHSVPNSQVHALQTVGDVIGFYETSVDTTVPYDALKKMELPENLHIQYDYVRFHPDTDTKFDGQTAFPKSSTLVTGLKYRGKYPGHTAKTSWP